MSASWISLAQSKIFTILKTKMVKKYKTKFPDCNITTKQASGSNQSFPTVYLHFLPSPELGADLEGKTINGIMSTVEIQVTANKKQGDSVAQDFVFAAMDILKGMMFQVVMMPESIPTGNDTSRYVMRMRRVIGAGDKI